MIDNPTSDQTDLRLGATVIQSALDTLDDHVALLDSAGLIVFVNAAWRRFGDANGAANRGNDVGRSYLQICGATLGTDAPTAICVADGLRELLDGRREELRVEYSCPTSAGLRWFLLLASPFAADGARYALVSHRDITERVQAERSRRDSDDRHRLIWEATNDGMALSDPEGTVVAANPAYYRIYGGSPAEVIGVSFARIFPPRPGPGPRAPTARPSGPSPPASSSSPRSWPATAPS